MLKNNKFHFDSKFIYGLSSIFYISLLIFASPYWKLIILGFISFVFLILFWRMHLLFGPMICSYARLITLFCFILVVLYFLLELTKYWRIDGNYYIVAYLSISLIHVIVFVVDFLWAFLKIINEYNLKDQLTKRQKFERNSFIVLGIFSAFVVPDIAFGFMYQLFSLSDELKPTNYFYLSFVIHYALPLNSQKYLDVIEMINISKLGGIIQFCHVTLNKILDLTFISTLFQSLSSYFKIKKTKNKKS